MTLLGEFEQRLERAVEGFFARVFRSGVHPVEIGKRLLRVMEDGKTVGLRKTYAPSVFRIMLSKSDYDRLSPLEAKLTEELEVFVAEAARQRSWVLSGPPRVSFLSGPRLSPGEFRIETEAATDRPRPRAVAAHTPARGEPRTRVMSTGTPKLVVLDDDGSPLQTVELGRRIRIGRQADNDLVLADSGVSRHHAEVIERNGEYLLRDLGSTNGTTLNGQILQEDGLDDGDRFVVGGTVIEFKRA